MKVWSSEHSFNYPWETVVQAVWKKYPNPLNPAVISTDVIDRQVIDGVLYSHRLVSSKWGFPGWVQKLIGSANICYACEQSIVNPKTKMMILKTCNITFSKYVVVNEILRYESDPNDSEKTLLKQEATITVRGVPFSNCMEDLLTNAIKSNAGKGRQAIEWVIGKINNEVAETKNAVASTADSKYSIDGVKPSTE